MIRPSTSTSNSLFLPVTYNILPHQHHYPVLTTILQYPPPLLSLLGQQLPSWFLKYSSGAQMLPDTWESSSLCFIAPLHPPCTMCLPSSHEAWLDQEYGPAQRLTWHVTRALHKGFLYFIMYWREGGREGGLAVDCTITADWHSLDHWNLKYFNYLSKF